MDLAAITSGAGPLGFGEGLDTKVTKVVQGRSSGRHRRNFSPWKLRISVRENRRPRRIQSKSLDGGNISQHPISRGQGKLSQADVDEGKVIVGMKICVTMMLMGIFLTMERLLRLLHLLRIR